MRLDMRVKTNLESFGLSGTVEGPLVTLKYGLSLGFITHFLDIEGVEIGLRSMGNTTPIDDEHCDIRILHSVRRTPVDMLNEMIEANYAASFKAAVDQDVVIWENKIHLARPRVCDGDGPITKFRKWARQFYAADEIQRIYGREAS